MSTPQLRGIAVALVFSVGCLSYQGYPTRYNDPKADLKKLQTHFDDAQIAACNQTRSAACRDIVVNSLVRSIDLQFDAFRRQLFQAGSSTNFWSDTSVMALGVAGTLVTSVVAPYLAAASALITGTRAAIERDLMFQKTSLILINSMETLRAEKLIAIEAGMKQPWDQYSLSAALNDIEAYYVAGTVPAAISAINAATTTKAQEVQQQMREVK